MFDAATYAEKLENHESRTGLPYLDPHQQQAVRPVAGAMLTGPPTHR